MAILKRSRTREAPTPTNISTNSEPERWKNGTPASPATARASKVFPVPGAPVRITPFGMRAPISRNFFGLFKKSTISFNSSLASLQPATSLKVTRLFLSFGSVMRALDWPKENACMPAPFTWRDKYQKKSKMKIIVKINGDKFPSQYINPLSSFIWISVFASSGLVTP